MLAAGYELLSNNSIVALYGAIYAVGIVVAMANWSKYPTAALMAATGLGIKLALSVIRWLPQALDSEFLSHVLSLPSLLTRGLHAGALILVVFAVFADRKTRSSFHSDDYFGQEER